MRMMQRDYLGNPLSAGSSTLRAVDDFIEGYLAYETRAEGIIAAADRDPESCIANVYAGFLWMLLEAPDAPNQAARYLAAAERTAVHATRREQLNAAILRAWVEDDVPATLRRCEETTDEFPTGPGRRQDAAVSRIQSGQLSGDAPGRAEGHGAQRRRPLHVRNGGLRVRAMPPARGSRASGAHGARAAPQGALGSARPRARDADAAAASTEGAAFLEGIADTWTGLNSFMITHLWWHLALFYLSQGRSARVLEIYDGHCWGVEKRYSQDQIGAVSLLARMEIAGIDVGDAVAGIGEISSRPGRATPCSRS